MWDDRVATEYPSLTGAHNTSVCVVGLGGSGLTAVGRLRELGCDVIGVDAGTIGSGAAGRNGGFLLAGVASFHHDAVAKLGRRRAVELYRLTMVELRRIVDETPETVRLDGSLRVAESEAELADCRLQLEMMVADGFPAEWYQGEEGEGLLIPTDGVFQPLERCRILAERAAADGAQLHEGSRVVAIEPGRVSTQNGSVDCEHVIVAVDGGLEQLLPELVGKVRTARLQMLATEATTELRTPYANYSRYGYEYWQQLPDGGIALGGMRDKGGEAEWTTSSEPSEPVQSLLEEHLRNRLGVSRARVTHRWAGSVAYTPLGAPVCEEVRDRVWAIGGYSGTGNVVGPICARAVVESVMTGSSDLIGVLAG